MRTPFSHLFTSCDSMFFFDDLDFATITDMRTCTHPSSSLFFFVIVLERFHSVPGFPYICLISNSWLDPYSPAQRNETAVPHRELVFFLRVVEGLCDAKTKLAS